MPTARLVRLAARPRSRVRQAVDRSARARLLLQGARAPGPGPLRPTGSCGARVGGWGRGGRLSAPLPGRPVGWGGGRSLPPAVPRAGPSGGLSPPSPPRRPYRSGHLSEFPVSPDPGGNGEAEGVQVTLRGCRDFPETKKRAGVPPSSSFPEEKGKRRTPFPSSRPRGQVERGRFPPRGPTRGPRGTLVPGQLPRDPQAVCPSPAATCCRGSPSGAPLGPRHVAPSLPPRTALRPLNPARPAPAALALRTPAPPAALPTAHGAPSPPRFSLLRPGPRTPHRDAHLPHPGPGAPAPRPSSCSTPPTELVSSSIPRGSLQSSPARALILGGGVRVPRATPPAGPSLRARGGAAGARADPGGAGGAGRRSRGKDRDKLQTWPGAGPRGNLGTLPGPSPRRHVRAGEGSVFLPVRWTSTVVGASRPRTGFELRRGFPGTPIGTPGNPGSCCFASCCQRPPRALPPALPGPCVLREALGPLTQARAPEDAPHPVLLSPLLCLGSQVPSPSSGRPSRGARSPRPPKAGDRG